MILRSRRLIVVVILLAGIACGGIDALPFIGDTEVPTPASSAIDAFVWQTDGEFGYRMLRPASWRPLDLGDARGYVAPEDTGNGRMTLTAANLRALAEILENPDVELLSLQQFEQSGSLDGWTDAIEQVWREQNLSFSLEHTSSRAKIYALTPSPDQVQLIAYVVDDEQPLVLNLVGAGTLEQVRTTGTFDDVVTMVESVTAIDRDPTAIEPPLTEQ